MDALRSGRTVVHDWVEGQHSCAWPWVRSCTSRAMQGRHISFMHHCEIYFKKNSPSEFQQPSWALCGIRDRPKRPEWHAAKEVMHPLVLAAEGLFAAHLAHLQRKSEPPFPPSCRCRALQTNDGATRLSAAALLRNSDANPWHCRWRHKEHPVHGRAPSHHYSGAM